MPEKILVGIIITGIVLLFLSGLFTYLCGCLKPEFFFRHPQVVEQVKNRGIAGAGRLYCVLGLYCMGFAFVVGAGLLLVATEAANPSGNQWTLLLYGLIPSGLLIMTLSMIGKRINPVDRC